MLKTLWFRPTYSRTWHIVHKMEYVTLSLCRTWRVPGGVLGVERADDAPGNCCEECRRRLALCEHRGRRATKPGHSDGTPSSSGVEKGAEE